VQGQMTCVCLAFLGCAARREWLDGISRIRAQDGLCRVGDVLTQTEQQPSWEWRRKGCRARQEKRLEIWMERVMSIACCLVAGG